MLLKQWINRLLGREQDDQQAQTRAQIVSRLQRIQRNHQFLQATFPDQPEVRYQSLILAVDTDENLLTIDELYPVPEQRTISAGDLVTISQKDHGRILQFVTHIRDVVYDNEIPSYHIDIPESVDQTQQRRFFRVQVPLDSGLKLYVQTTERVLCSVINISPSGIGFNIAGNLVDWLRENRTLAESILELPNGISIECTIQMKSMEFVLTPQRHTQVGGVLSDISSHDQKKLDQYLLSLQRLQRQRELGEA